MRKNLLAIILLALTCTSAVAQQDAQYTMYMFNRQVINPGYAGALEALNVTLLGRAQWVGIQGAPRTTTASINGYVEKLHGGIGGHIIGDKLGPLSTVGVKAGYSFHANIGSAKLQIGAQGGVYQKSLNGDWKYNTDPGIDPLVPLGKTSMIVPDVDAGLYFHVPLNRYPIGAAYPQDRFFLGASVSHILEPQIDNLLDADIGIQSVLARDIFGIIGYTITLDQARGIHLTPSGQFRMAGTQMQWDINANLYIAPMVFGVSHRWKDSFSGIIGFNATTQLFMAYSYDYTVSNLRTHTTGSHELIVSYTFPSKRKTPMGEKGVRDYN